MIKKIYEELEEGINIKNVPEYSSLVNFSENFELPRHRWFNIKEGFSAEIIKRLIKRFDGNKQDLVFDPFSGSGTTLVASKELGISSLGFEVNPFLAFVGKNKLYNKKIDLSQHVDKIKDLKIRNDLEPPKLSISEKLFGNELNKVLSIRDYIKNVSNESEKDLLKLVFLCSLEKASIAKKDGNGLKYPKNKVPLSIIELMSKKINEVEEDINNHPFEESESQIFNEDVRKLEDFIPSKLKKYKEEVTLCLFSPPYMNCFDYTEVYKMELWFGDFIKEYSDLKILRNLSLDSHLNKSFNKDYSLNKYSDFFSEIVAKKDVWSKKIPFMIKGYFNDMRRTLKGIHLLLKERGKCVIVVGNSAYGNIAIPTDLILGQIGLELGFRKCDIEVARKLGTSSQQYKKINDISILRESLVILEK